MKQVVMCILTLSFSLNSIASLENYFKSKQMNSLCQQASAYNELGGSRDLSKVIAASDKFIYMGLSADGDGRLIIKNRLNNMESMIDFDSSVKNIQLQGDEVIITTSKDLLVLNQEDNSTLFKFRTLPSNMAISKNGGAFGAYKYKGVYYIAHGKLGIIPFDTKTMTHLSLIMPHLDQSDERMISMVTGIAGSQNKLYLAYDDLTLSSRSKAFEGVVIFDLDNKSTLKRVRVNQSRESYYMPSLVLDSEELIVSNLNLNFRHDLKKLMRARYMKPKKRIWRYPLGELIGRGYIQDLKIFGCFKNRETKTISSGWFAL